MSQLSTCQQKRKKVAKKEKSYDDDYNSDLNLTLSTSCPKNRVHHTPTLRGPSPDRCEAHLNTKVLMKDNAKI
jgi:hypothetical protein